MGRFLTEDPAGIVNGPNLCVYALGAPTLFRDPFGLYIPSPTANCYVEILSKIIESTGQTYRQWISEAQHFDITLPMGGAWRYVEIWVIRVWWQRYIVWEQMFETVTYQYVCFDECGNREPPLIGVDRTEFWRPGEEGTEYWFDPIRVISNPIPGPWPNPKNPKDWW